MSDKIKQCNMKYSGIGGQAVMEGVMMRNQDKYAVAVRRPDGEVEIKAEDYKGLFPKALGKIPFLRGVFSFIDSLVLGMKALNFSVDIYAEEEAAPKKADSKGAAGAADSAPAETTDSASAGATDSAPAGAADSASSETTDSASSETTDGGPAETEANPANEAVGKAAADKEKSEKSGGGIVTTIVMIIAIFLAVGLFMVLPYYLSLLFTRWIGSPRILALIEGVIRLLIFIAYILLISRMEDIKRVFRYHGAEHKCINCLETGRDLTVENVRDSSKQHRRCGTSFLLYVMVISIIFFSVIQMENRIMRVVLRIVLIPVIAGVSYEIIRLAGRSNNPIVRALSAPGLWMQRLTTAEPDDSMIEIGIASVEAVFDWRKYLKENFGDL